MKTVLTVLLGSFGVWVGMNIQQFAGIGIEAIIGVFTIGLLVQKIKNEKAKRQNNLDCDRCSRFAFKLMGDKEDENEK